MDDNRPDNQPSSGSVDRPPEIESGADYAPRPLPTGTHVDNFVVGRLVCNSFSGYTYAATDSGNRSPLIIQEYFPEEVSVRDLDRVSVLLRDETVSNEFEFGLSRFYRLTRALAKYKGKGHVASAFDQNDTAYYACAFDIRCTLNDVLNSGKRVPGANIEKWLKACLRFLVAPHHANLLHLGIQADSILLDGEGDAILVGFNSVGPSFHTEPHKPEYLYLPIERIRSEAEMLPASDLYSLAAVLLHAMTGEPPPHAARRTGAVSTGRVDPLDEQLKRIEQQHSQAVIRVLRWMMAPQPKDRPQSAVEALGNLDARAVKPIPTVRSTAGKTEPVAAPPADKPAKVRPIRRPESQSTKEPIESVPRPIENSPPVVNKPIAVEKPAEASADVPTLDPLRVDPREDTIRSPQSWFSEEDVNDSRRGLVGSVLNHPVSWVGAIVIALAAAWFWLGTTPDSQTRERQSASVPRINVIPDAPQAQTEPAAATPEVRPEVVLESASRITGGGDTQKFQELRQLDALERRLEPHFHEAEAHLANGDLVAPENANALTAFREVLALDSGNERALEGIEKIQGLLVERAQTAMDDGNLERAEQTIAHVSSIDDTDPNIDRIRSAIAQIRLQQELAAEAERRRAAEEARQQAEEQQRQAQLEGLLSQAVTSFDSGRLVEPPLDNALYYYREMLKIEPANPQANTGIEQIAAQFVRQSRQALASNDLELADRNLTTAAAIDPANQEIPTVREQIAARQRLAAQEQRALAEAQRSQQAAQQAARSQAEMSLQSGISAYYRGLYDEAYSFLRPLAEDGNARAQFRLAVMLQNGRGVETNRAEARKWFLSALEPIRIAAEEGRAWAQADMGSYYEDGIILDANNNEAAKWYLRSAEQGYAGAQTNLGVMYANGQGVEPDINQAVEWFKRAAVQGDSIAKENLRILGYNPNNIVLGAQN